MQRITTPIQVYWLLISNNIGLFLSGMNKMMNKRFLKEPKIFLLKLIHSTNIN